MFVVINYNVSMPNEVTRNENVSLGDSISFVSNYQISYFDVF